MRLCVIEFSEILHKIQAELHLDYELQACICMDGDVQLHNLLDENKRNAGWVADRVDDLNHNAKNIYKKINTGLKGTVTDHHVRVSVFITC
jgi:hypothetical protein